MEIYYPTYRMSRAESEMTKPATKTFTRRSERELREEREGVWMSKAVDSKTLDDLINKLVARDNLKAE
jgi:hypothetical protein